MGERTFVMVKPNHFSLAEVILNDLDRQGKRVKTVTVDAVPLEVIQEHYAPHRGRSFYGYMTEFFAGKPVMLAVYEGEDVIRRTREAVGATDPSKADSNSIRGRFSHDSLDAALAEKRPCSNVVHCSDSPEEADREIGVWQEYLRL